MGSMDWGSTQQTIDDTLGKMRSEIENAIHAVTNPGAVLAAWDRLGGVLKKVEKKLRDALAKVVDAISQFLEYLSPGWPPKLHAKANEWAELASSVSNLKSTLETKQYFPATTTWDAEEGRLYQAAPGLSLGAVSKLAEQATAFSEYLSEHRKRVEDTWIKVFDTCASTYANLLEQVVSLVGAIAGALTLDTGAVWKAANAIADFAAEILRFLRDQIKNLFGSASAAEDAQEKFNRAINSTDGGYGPGGTWPSVFA